MSPQVSSYDVSFCIFSRFPGGRFCTGHWSISVYICLRKAFRGGDWEFGGPHVKNIYSIGNILGYTNPKSPIMNDGYMIDYD
jgi:hypothetical protein